jgi:methionyl-tRNA synthetase
VLHFAYKHWGYVPQPGELRPLDIELLKQVEQGFVTVGQLLEAVKLRPALQEALALARLVNAYLEQAPWFRVVNKDEAAAATTVYVALQAIDWLKLLLSPFLPHSTEALHRLLGYEGTLFGRLHINSYQETEKTHEALVYQAGGANGRWQPNPLPPGQRLARPYPLYKKVDESLVEAELNRLYCPPGG